MERILQTLMFVDLYGTAPWAPLHKADWSPALDQLYYEPTCNVALRS